MNCASGSIFPTCSTTLSLFTPWSSCNEFVVLEILIVYSAQGPGVPAPWPCSHGRLKELFSSNPASKRAFRRFSSGKKNMSRTPSYVPSESKKNIFFWDSNQLPCQPKSTPYPLYHVSGENKRRKVLFHAEFSWHRETAHCVSFPIRNRSAKNNQKLAEFLVFYEMRGLRISRAFECSFQIGISSSGCGVL